MSKTLKIQVCLSIKMCILNGLQSRGKSVSLPIHSWLAPLVQDPWWMVSIHLSSFIFITAPKPLAAHVLPMTNPMNWMKTENGTFSGSRNILCSDKLRGPKSSLHDFNIVRSFKIKMATCLLECKILVKVSEFFFSFPFKNLVRVLRDRVTSLFLYSISHERNAWFQCHWTRIKRK